MIIELRGGTYVDDAALALAIRLEFAGCSLTAHDGRLLVSQAAALTAADREAIRRHRLMLLAIVNYRVPV